MALIVRIQICSKFSVLFCTINLNRFEHELEMWCTRQMTETCLRVRCLGVQFRARFSHSMQITGTEAFCHTVRFVGYGMCYLYRLLTSTDGQKTYDVGRECHQSSNAFIYFSETPSIRTLRYHELELVLVVTSASPLVTSSIAEFVAVRGGKVIKDSRTTGAYKSSVLHQPNVTKPETYRMGNPLE